LRLNSALAPFGFTHLVTSVNPLKLATSLACRRFVRLQLLELGSSFLCWDKRSEHDPGVEWLKNQILQIAQHKALFFGACSQSGS
jgi:hypothetical protein